MEDILETGLGAGSADDKALSPMWEFLNEEYDYQRPQRGDIREGVVLRKEHDFIVVDIGAKREGIVPASEIDKLGRDILKNIKVGDEVPVYIVRPDTPDGDVIVSLSMARSVKDWQKAQEMLETGEIFEAEVTGHNKGGLIVPFGLIRGFLPASHVVNLASRGDGENRGDQLATMVGQALSLKVIEVDRRRQRLIISERLAVKEEREKKKVELLEELREGEIRKGIVSNLCDFGAFVDLGGADGLIHISELSWQRVKHPREVLNAGDEVEVYVLKVDEEKKRIGLSLKRLQPDPWTTVGEKYELGQVVKGTITSVVKFGAFARIEDGLEGLIHVSEVAEGDFLHPRNVVQEGDAVEVRIISIDPKRRRMGLSLKQAEGGQNGAEAPPGASPEEPAAVGETQPLQQVVPGEEAPTTAPEAEGEEVDEETAAE